MFSKADYEFMRHSLRLARRGYGTVSPNPMVGAVLVKRGIIIGRGWHRIAGGGHAEVEAIADARRRGSTVKGATLYVTLEPCSSFGRTPPCTEAIHAAGVKSVVVAATDPNPRHGGRAFAVLRRLGIRVRTGLMSEEAKRLNEPFNHWIVRGSPFVTVKSAMTLDGKIATASGESKWITGEKARWWAMRLRFGADAILAGVNTVLADDPSLTVRNLGSRGDSAKAKGPRRIILDSRARTPVDSRIVSDRWSDLTTIVVTKRAPSRRLAVLRKSVNVWVAPSRDGRVDLKWLLRKLGSESVTSLLVEGGGEVSGSFFSHRLVHRIAFFYAPMIMGGASDRKSVGGPGARSVRDALQLENIEWRRIGTDLLMTARVR